MICPILLLFDYYQGELHLKQEKPLYVFVSHNHYDHYNPEIYHIDHPNITYIIDTTAIQEDLKSISDSAYIEDFIINNGGALGIYVQLYERIPDKSELNDRILERVTKVFLTSGLTIRSTYRWR